MSRILHWSRMFRGSCVTLVGLLALGGCQSLTGNEALPAGTTDPAAFQNAKGAREMANAARSQFLFGLADYIPVSGLLTDELQSNARGASLAESGLFAGQYLYIDARLMQESTPAGSPSLASDYLYFTLQQARALINVAIGALAKYDADSSASNRGELYAFYGYAEIMLADLFCSGVPLSTLDFEKDYTYKPGSSTAQVYRHAVTLFDSALALAGDSVSIASLAKVGQGRAYLALGEYAAAAQAVNGVAPDFRYTFRMRFCGNISAANCAQPGRPTVNIAPLGGIAERDGVTGLPFRSSGDPRMASTFKGTTAFGDSIFVPNKYPAKTTDGDVVLASGIEGELIRAEANLRAGGTAWLGILNALRTTCLSDSGCPTPAPAGSGGIDGLPPLPDPGASQGDTARLSLVMRERGFWLYLTGVRQGDLRRLVQQDGRDAETVYPSQSYPELGTYGTNIDAPIPVAEFANPLYTGCLNRD